MRFHVDCRPQIRIVHWKSQCSQGGSQGGFQKGTMFWMSLCFSLTWDSMSRNGQRQGFMVAWLCIAARSRQKKLPLGSPVKNRLSAILATRSFVDLPQADTSWTGPKAEDTSGKAARKTSAKHPAKTTNELGPAWQNIAGNLSPSHSRTKGTLEKIKQPKSLLSCNEEVYVSKEVKVNALDSHQRANHSDQKWIAENQLLVFTWRHKNSNYKTVDPTEILLSWCIRAAEN